MKILITCLLCCNIATAGTILGPKIMRIHVKPFERIFKHKVKNVIFSFNREQVPTIVAACTRAKDSMSGFPEITFDKIYWRRLSLTHRAIIIFHELCHCVANAKHVSGKLHIMNAEPPRTFKGIRKVTCADY